jgi:glycine C-acetyltransferase
MHDLSDIASWLQHHPIYHDSSVHSTLPDPTFVTEGETVVSFSTNNYLALANHPRLVAAAKQGLDRYGVGNCESRLLGGDLEVYRELERRLGALKHKSDAVLFVTGYMANIGVLSSIVKAATLARLHGFRRRNATSTPTTRTSSITSRSAKASRCRARCATTTATAI